RNADGSFKHRNPFRIRSCRGRRIDSSIQTAREAPRISRARRTDRSSGDNTDLRPADGWPSDRQLDSILRLADNRIVPLLFLWAATQRACHCKTGGVRGQRRKALMRPSLSFSLALMLAILVLSLPSSFAWGDNVQRLITSKALDTLPDEIR